MPKFNILLGKSPLVIKWYQRGHGKEEKYKQKATTIYSCNMGTRDLSDMYVQNLRAHICKVFANL